jgi:hypothetical protein
MHVLTATAQTQGIEPDDFSFTLPGELVRLPYGHCGDEACGCRRAFVGLGSRRATTSALVVDRPELRPLDVWNLLVGAALDEHPGGGAGFDSWFAGFAALARAAAALPVGAVVGRDPDGLHLRRELDLVLDPGISRRDRPPTDRS